MSQEKLEQALDILQAMHAAQLQALERQARQLEISEVLLAQAEKQYQNAEKITSRAEALQNNAGKAIKFLVAFGVVAISLLVLVRCL
jgi:hypothetical protein